MATRRGGPAATPHNGLPLRALRALALCGGGRCHNGQRFHEITGVAKPTRPTD
jgi:hypothetical protein